jgi:hypothetical protein
MSVVYTSDCESIAQTCNISDRLGGVVRVCGVARVGVIVRLVILPNLWGTVDNTERAVLTLQASYAVRATRRIRRRASAAWAGDVAHTRYTSPHIDPSCSSTARSEPRSPRMALSAVRGQPPADMHARQTPPASVDVHREGLRSVCDLHGQTRERAAPQVWDDDESPGQEYSCTPRATPPPRRAPAPDSLFVAQQPR